MAGEPAWWARPDLGYRDGRLHFAGTDLAALARQAPTPTYVYRFARMRANLERLAAALAAAGLEARLYYAMKANRHPGLLALLAASELGGSGLAGSGLCGVDVCSPGEVLLARQCGFPEAAISFTGTSVSAADMAILARHPGLWINCDSLSTIRRVGEATPGRAIGIRVNPGIGTGYGTNEMLRYAGGRAVKLGIHREQFDEALALARHYGLRVTTLHFHAGCGYLTAQLPGWAEALDSCLDFVDRAGTIDTVNIGGGLGVPLTPSDAPLDLGVWAGLLKARLGARGLKVALEPGAYAVADAGVLLLSATFAETKRDVTLVGVDGGFNLHPEPAFYHLPCQPVTVEEPEAAPETWRPTTVVGNINEALDIWAEGLPLPPIREGQVIAFLNAGAYGAAMSSDHCRRGAFAEYLLP